MRRPAIRSTAHDPILSYPIYLSRSRPRSHFPNEFTFLIGIQVRWNSHFVGIGSWISHRYGFSYGTITVVLCAKVGSDYFHYSDVIMSAMASQITGVSSVCSTVCSGADQRKHQSFASLACIRVCPNFGAAYYKAPSCCDKTSVDWRISMCLQNNA